MRSYAFVGITLLFAYPAGALADAELGSRSYQVCAGCHGFHGEGNALVYAPKLSGQEDWYLRRQMNNFANGVRGNEIDDANGKSMAMMIKALDAQDIADVAAFIGTLPNNPINPVVQGDVAIGKQLYETCGACHGANAEGNVTLNAPALAGMSDWYQLSQLKKFKNGLRGSHPGDLYGQQMAPMVSTLDEDAMHNVIAYINSLQ